MGYCTRSCYDYDLSDHVYTIEATITPSNATNTTIEFTSSNTNVASIIDPDYLYTPNTYTCNVFVQSYVGTATITARAIDGSGAEATINVEVTPQVLASGQCGDQMQYVHYYHISPDENGKDNRLVISGSGNMYNNLKRKVAEDTEVSAFTPPFSGEMEVVFDGDILSIGAYAFSVVEDLHDIALPQSIKTLGDGCFEYTSLSSISIPKSVTSIGKGIVGECYQLTSIYVETGNTKYDSRNDCNAIIETATNTLIQGCKATVIPNGVTRIEDLAFYGMNECYESEPTISLIIPSSVESIGEQAFVGFGFKDISVGYTPPTIQSSTFGEMDEYPWTLYVPKGCKTRYESAEYWNRFANIQEYSTTEIRYTSTDGNIVVPKDGAFLDSNNHELPIIGNTYSNGIGIMTTLSTVASIGCDGFSGCKNLKSIVIPREVREIGDRAFSGCSTLETVNILGVESLTTIHVFFNPFSSSRSLKVLQMPRVREFSGVFGGMWEDVNGFYAFEVFEDEVQTFYSYSLSSLYLGEVPPNCVFDDPRAFNYLSPIPHLDSNGIVYVPLGCKSIYQSTAYWKNKNIEEYSRLRIDDFEACIGKTIELPIYLENTEEMTSLEFDLYLPEGISVPYTTGRNGAINYTSSIIKGSDRFDEDSDHAISAKMTEDGALRVLLHSNTNMAFYDTDIENQDCRKTSPLLTLKLQISSDMEEGSQIIDLRNVIAASYTDGVTKKHELIDWSAQIDLHATRVVTVVSADAEKGSVLIEGENYNAETHEVPYGEAVTLTATPSTGYHFVHWIAGETVLSTENPYQLTVDDDHAIQAVFAVNQYSVRFVADGTAVYDELQDYGSAIALPEAPDKPGYAFYSWGEVDETVPAHNVEYVAEYVLVGDVYTDATIDIADVTSLVGLVLNDVTPTGRELLQADVYADKQIDIADVTGAVGLVLNSSHSAAPRDMESFGTGVISLTAEESMNIENSAHCLSIGLNNADCMVQALQFDITLPEGVELTSANLHRNLHATDRLDHSLTASRLDEHTVRVMLYSLAANTIDGEEGEILTIDLQTTSSAVGSIIELTNIKAVTTDGEPHELTSVEVVVGNVTGIGILTVAQHVTVYDLEGRLVLSEYLSAGFDLKQRLGAGTYVVNGKKINLE